MDWLIGCTIKMAFEDDSNMHEVDKNLWENLEDRMSDDAI